MDCSILIDVGPSVGRTMVVQSITKDRARRARSNESNDPEDIRESPKFKRQNASMHCIIMNSRPTVPSRKDPWVARSQNMSEETKSDSKHSTQLGLLGKADREIGSRARKQTV